MREIFVLYLGFIVLCGCAGKKLMLKEERISVEPETLKGEIIWQKRFKSIPACEPVGKYGYIFLPLLNKSVYIIEPETGDGIRRIYTDFLINSMLIEGEILYLTGIGEWNSVLGINLKTLDKVFNKSADPTGGKLLYCKYGLLFLTNRGKIFLIDHLTGAKKAEQNLNILPAGFATNGELVAVISVDGSIILLTADGLRIRRRKDFQTKVESAPSFEKNIVFGALDGTVYCLDTTLAEIFEAKVEGRITVPPAVFGDFVFVCTKNGELFKIRKDDGEINKSVKVEGPVVIAPVMAGNSVVIGNLKGDLFIIDQETLNIEKKVKLSGMIKHQPLIYGGRLYVATEDGYLYCIE